MIDKKIEDKINKLCTKISNVFTDFYILRHGYIISLDIEKPYIIQLTDEEINWFNDLCGEFKLLHIWDVRNFKKDMNNYITQVTSNNEINKVIDLLTQRIQTINMCDKWENFILSENIEDNTKLLLSLFKENNYVNFLPKDNITGPEIIMTKSLIPLVSEKNYTNLYYSTKKIDSDLYLLVFDFQFDMFRLYMLHHYIPIK